MLLGGVPARATAAGGADVVMGMELVGETTMACNDGDGPLELHGGDLAFWGNVAIVACGADSGKLTDDGFAIVDIADPAHPEVLGHFACVASSSDVAVWNNLVFLAVDGNNDTEITGVEQGWFPPRPLYTGPATEECDAPIIADTGKKDAIFRGVRVVSIANPQKPRLLANVRLPQTPLSEADGPHRGGNAHNLTLEPVADRTGEVTKVRVYANDPDTAKNYAFEVDLETDEIGDPSEWRGAKAELCHDLAILVPQNLSACNRLRGGTVVLDLEHDTTLDYAAGSDDPTTNRNWHLYHHHSSAFSWDGRTVVVTDEHLPALASDDCQSAQPLGAVWFYEPDFHFVESPPLERYLTSMAPAGYALPPPVKGNGFCSSKQLNVVPMDNGRDVAVVSWNGGGTSVIDFTNPKAPRTIAYYAANPGGPKRSAAWTAHWYNGYVYVNNAFGCFFGRDCDGAKERGLDVLRVTAPLADGSSLAEHAIPLRRFNFGTQECLPGRPDPEVTNEFELAAFCPRD